MLKCVVEVRYIVVLAPLEDTNFLSLQGIISKRISYMIFGYVKGCSIS